MAEEEVLDETPVAAKKVKSGGITLGQLISIGVILIFVTVAATLFLTGRLSNFFGSVNDRLTQYEVSRQGLEAQMKGMTKVNPCNKKNQMVYSLSEDPMIINMADGEHYISTEMAVCVDGREVTEDEFTKRIPQIRHVVNDSLSRISKDDLFGSGATEEEMAEMAALGLPGQGESGDAFAKNLNNYRGELLPQLSGNFPWIIDVYFTSFLIQ